MSFSFQLAHSCPHMIMGEVVTLSADDKRSMFLRGPVANNQSVLVSANGIYVPPTGYHSLPSVSTATGPFKIQNCVGTSGGGNEALTVTTLSGSVALSLPVGPRVSLAKVKRTLVLGASGLFSVSEKHGTLVLTGLGETGSKSYIQVSGKGAASLGFSQLKSRGREVYPPWSLNARPNQLPTWGGTGIVQQNRAMYPRFSKPLRGSPILKVTYATTGGQCPRCQGTLIENDYRFNALGNLMVVANEDLLYQACLKAILTNKGSNPYSPAYGTMIQGRIGMKAARAGASLVQEDIMNVLQGSSGHPS